MGNFIYADPYKAGDQFVQSIPSPLNYSSFEYHGMREKILEWTKLRFGDKYDNFVDSDFGVMIIEFLAYQADILSFKLDYYINECFLSTAILDKSIRRHARGVGYKPRPTTSAVYDFMASIESPISYDVIIPSGFEISTSHKDGRPLWCQLYAADSNGNIAEGESIVIPAGATSNLNIIGVEGRGRGVDYNGDGTEFQIVEISEEDVLYDSIKVLVDGEEWVRVNNFGDYDQKNIYKVEIDDRTKKTYVVFGNGIHGNVVPNGSPIKTWYRVGGGDRGNVRAGAFSVTMTVCVKGTHIFMPVVFNNISRGRGGSEKERGDEIKINLPAWYRTQGRAVSISDYTTLANLYYGKTSGRVGRSKAYLRHQGCSANIIDVYIVEYIDKKSICAPSDRLLSGVASYLEEVSDMTHHICVKPAKIIEVDLFLKLYIPRFYAKDSHRISANVKDYISNFFDLKYCEIGDSLKKSDISRFVEYIDEINGVDVNLFVDSGYHLDNEGNYIARHWEIVVPRQVDISVEYI